MINTKFKMYRTYIILAFVIHLVIAIISMLSGDQICGYYPYMLTCIHIPIICICINSVYTNNSDYYTITRYRDHKSVFLLIAKESLIAVLYYLALDIATLNVVFWGTEDIKLIAILCAAILGLYFLGGGLFALLRLYVSRGWISIIIILMLTSIEMIYVMGLTNFPISFFFNFTNEVIGYINGVNKYIYIKSFLTALFRVVVIFLLIVLSLPYKNWGITYEN